MRISPKFTILLVIAVSTFGAMAADSVAPAQQSIAAPHNLAVIVKMIGPYAEPCDLQIVCAFKHKATGDTYLSAMKDLDDKLGGLLSALRNRGEFVGELGETILLVPPKESIVPPRLLVIGLGEESGLSLETLRVVGRVALRQAVLLQAAHVAFAPVLRDQGNSTLDVGEGDRAVIESVISAYDTEKRLQAQKLAPAFSIQDWTLEAGPTFFEGATKRVEAGVAAAQQMIAGRKSKPYLSPK